MWIVCGGAGINWQPLSGSGSHSAAAAKSLQSCPTLCDPIDGSPPGSLSLGFSRREHWSGLPFPSPMHESEKWKWSRSVMFDSSRPHELQPTRLLYPRDFPGKSTGVECHRLLRVVAQSGLTLSDPPGSSVHGILQARILQWVVIPFSRDFPNPGIEPRPPALQAGSLPAELPGKAKPAAWPGPKPISFHSICGFCDQFYFTHSREIKLQVRSWE